MLLQCRTSRHDRKEHNARPERQQREMPHPRSLIFSIISTLFLFARHFVEIRVFLRNPVCFMQFGCVDVALLFSMVAQQEDAGERPIYWTGPVRQENKKATL
jgi:hypothetical protein